MKCKRIFNSYKCNVSYGYLKIVAITLLLIVLFIYCQIYFLKCEKHKFTFENVGEL